MIKMTLVFLHASAAERVGAESADVASAASAAQATMATDAPDEAVQRQTI